MKITSVEFVKSVVNIKELPTENLQEIAISGRSNVGKSSLINCLLNRKKLAKTSSTPGKTRQLNYFRINNQFFLVDLPGYGFAKVAKSEMQQWRNLIEGFIEQSKNLKGVVALIDSRIGPTLLDIQLIEWLSSLKIPTVLVATKADKLSKGRVKIQVADYAKQIRPYYNKAIIPFSVINGMGKTELWREMILLME
ncbi:MAG TPA: ribosome biogenesis GTP-binding protein YihA/YsxC [bacterium]